MSNNPTGRALQLLSLLQTHRRWRGNELADRLGVTERTVRRDVDRLRELGYPVDATPGSEGGYRLAAGAHLPPLVLDDGEAVAMAIGLRSAAGAAITGIEDASLQALAKIERILPDRLRRRVAALDAAVSTMRWGIDDSEVVDSDALAVLAVACRDSEEVRFDYESRGGDQTRRLVEPHRLVTAGRRWYLVAWDLRRDDWRTFRLDRLADVRLAGGRFSPRPIPGGDAVAYVASSVSSMPKAVVATVAVDATYDDIAAMLARVTHTLVSDDTDRCVVEVRTDHLDWLVLAVARLALTTKVRVVEPPEARAAFDAFVANLS